MSVKYEELLDKVNDLVGKKEEKKCKCKWGWVLAIVGGIVAVAGIAYAVYRYLTPDYLEEFEDDFDDEYDDELFEDEEEEEKNQEDAKAEDKPAQTEE